MGWDLFCRVVDNHGDAGVCWRLAADLAARGERVRLFIDDAAALGWMAPSGARGVELLGWAAGDTASPAEVVIEAFGCDPPATYLQRMARAQRPPVWIDLEYLSAESYVERSHRLPSPQTHGPAAGLTRWFFYPGFTAATGGLIREAGLMAERARFDAMTWRLSHGIERRPQERVVSLFCYPKAPVDALVRRLLDAPTLLLVTAAVAAPAAQPPLRVQTLPYLSQADYDRLLWSSDLNFVRGEDSFVRAQWAGVPFVWQVYPQHDGVHLDKLDAFADRFLAGAAPSTSTACRAWLRAWNTGADSLPALPSPGPWQQHCAGWRERLLAQADLATQLIGFASEKR